MAKKNAKAAGAAGDDGKAGAAQASEKGKSKAAQTSQKTSQKSGTEGKAVTAKKGSQDKKGQAQTQKKGLGEKITQLRDFFEESKVELKKVTWPSRKETISTSVAVIVLTIVMSLFLSVVDYGLSKIVSYILS